MSNVTPPGGGLGSNSNYILSGNGQSFSGLTITIEVMQDIVGNVGFSFQLNAYSPAGKYSAWQQYVLAFQTSDGFPGPDGSPGTLSGQVEPWPVTTAGLGTDTTTSDLINQWYQIFSAPDSTIAAGSTLTISLANDSNGNVRYATFTMVDQNGKQWNTNPTPIDLVGLPLDITSGKKATETDLAPIEAFQLNFVGPTNGLQTYLWSGAGTITYSSGTAMTVLNGWPMHLDSEWHTLETANSVYGGLPKGPSNSIMQTFTAVDPGAYAAGGPFAVSQLFGASQTDLFAIDRAGQLIAFSVESAGHWSSSLPIFGPTGFAERGAAIAAAQQLGANQQTDVFLVGQNGQLNVGWTSAGGAWGGPETIGPASNAPSGANLAVSQQFGAPNQTDVFLVDNNGQLNVFWVDSAGAWDGPVTIGPKGNAPSGAPLVASQQFGAANQTDVFLVDNQGQLNVFWVVGTGAWNGPVKLGPASFAPAGANLAVSQQFGASNRTDVFLVDNNGQLNVFWVEGTGAWNGPVTIGPAGIAPAGAALAASQQFGAQNQTDVFLVDNNGQVNVFWVEGTGSWNGPVKISSPGFAIPGAFVAASQQFGLPNQTDLFVITAGTNGPGWPSVFWAVGPGPWNGPELLVTNV